MTQIGTADSLTHSFLVTNLSTEQLQVKEKFLLSKIKFLKLVMLAFLDNNCISSAASSFKSPRDVSLGLLRHFWQST